MMRALYDRLCVWLLVLRMKWRMRRLVRSINRGIVSEAEARRLLSGRGDDMPVA